MHGRLEGVIAEVVDIYFGSDFCFISLVKKIHFIRFGTNRVGEVNFNHSLLGKFFSLNRVSKGRRTDNAPT